MIPTIAVILSCLLAPATRPVAGHELILLTRDGRLVRTDGSPISEEKGIETIDHHARGHRLIATRGDEVLAISLASGKAEVLHWHGSPIRFATISPNGSVAYSAPVHGVQRVWLLNVDAGAAIGPQAIEREFTYGPSFSPDGRWIYYERGEAGLGRFDLENGQAEPFLPEHPGAHTVRCSPDGKHIAFSRDRALYVYRTDEKATRKLTDGHAYDRFATFAGDRVAFFREIDGQSLIVSMKLDGADERIEHRGDVLLACYTDPI